MSSEEAADQHDQTFYAPLPPPLPPQTTDYLMIYCSLLPAQCLKLQQAMKHGFRL